MPITILMPALSPTMKEGNLTKWLKKEGDTVYPGDVIAEIETDKATMEVEAVDEGRVGQIVVEEGAEGVKVESAESTMVSSTIIEVTDADDGETQAAHAALRTSRPRPCLPTCCPSMNANSVSTSGEIWLLVRKISRAWLRPTFDR